MVSWDSNSWRHDGQTLRAGACLTFYENVVVFEPSGWESESECERVHGRVRVRAWRVRVCVCACVHVKMSSSPLPNYHFPEKNWKVTRRRKKNEKHKKCDLLRPKNSMHASETFPGKNVVIEKSLNWIKKENSQIFERKEKREPVFFVFCLFNNYSKAHARKIKWNEIIFLVWMDITAPERNWEWHLVEWQFTNMKSNCDEEKTEVF